MICVHSDSDLCFLGRLDVRGLKTLRDRTRLQQVEARLGELSKDISSLRMKLSSKPG